MTTGTYVDWMGNILEAVITAGFAITGTWPMRTERQADARASESNALASSIVLVCRPRPAMRATTFRAARSCAS